ncbi:probable proteasome subunit beta type-2 [Drosophila novamexicana]|uniref:probable proteasome subunit beta type-2 n=1 Tax=Drosophila novamexicana TaxID=47314 RepID=UPI0011E5D297|nr:probable proteasome subunit beta type-2 [Drosophila novamexicana]XP_030555221.1 probable proteasome subunit beta type-2 [Drosophila novamexicana]
MAMETILGIKGSDFAMLACDTMQAKSVIFMKDDQSKIHRLSEFSMLAAVGDGGDTLQFTDYIAKHLQLYKISNNYHLTPRGTAHFTRKNLADYIRTNTRYQVSMLMAGYDVIEGPDLHYIDSYGAGMPINHAGHGLGSLFCGSIFQRYWTEGLKPTQAYDILKMCVAEIQKRLIINLRNFDVFVVDRNGTRQLESINPSSFDADMLCLSLSASIQNLGKKSLR